MNSVITYIFGEHQELLRNPLCIDSDTEYICVTDVPTLQSNCWKIIYSPLRHLYHNRLKFAYIKTHPFAYTKADNVLVIDGSMQIRQSIAPLFKMSYDILLKPHPLRNTLRDELIVWPNRGLSPDAMLRYIIMAECLKANLQMGPVYETNISLWHRNADTIQFGDITHKMMMKLSQPDSVFLSNQLVMSLLLQTKFAYLRVGSIEQQPYFIKYDHGTNIACHRQT